MSTANTLPEAVDALVDARRRNTNVVLSADLLESLLSTHELLSAVIARALGKTDQPEQYEDTHFQRFLSLEDFASPEAGDEA